MVVVVVILVAVIVVVALVLGMRWYIRRAGRITEQNEVRADFRSRLLLDLQEVRDVAHGDVARELDALIDKVRYDTPASNQRTTELDERVLSAASELEADPSVEAIGEVSRLLDARNRRAKR